VVLVAPEEKKKARELFLAREFLAAAGLHAQVEPGESPDFLLAFADGKRIALELTDLTDPIRAASTSAMERTGPAAEMLLAGLPVAAMVNWRTGAIVAPAEVSQLATELAAAVREACSRGRDTVRASDMLRHALLVGRADAIVLFESSDGPGVHTLGETHWLFGDEEAVQRSISAKERKASRYRARLPGVPMWLLVACGSRHGDANVPDMLNPKHVYATSFDRIAAFDAGTRGVLWLRTKPRVSDADSRSG
jgi:hypothetical protein